MLAGGYKLAECYVSSVFRTEGRSVRLQSAYIFTYRQLLWKVNIHYFAGPNSCWPRPGSESFSHSESGKPEDRQPVSQLNKRQIKGFLSHLDLSVLYCRRSSDYSSFNC